MEIPAQRLETEDDRAPSTEELVAAIAGDLTYVAQLCAAYSLLGDSKTLAKFGEKERGIFRNLIIELSLLFIRKTTEFFSPSKGRDDNLHASKYLDPFEPTWVINEEDYKILHKAVGHITIRGARRAVQKKPNDNWPIKDWARDAVEAWIAFYKELPLSPLFSGNLPLQEKIMRQREKLEEFAEICRKSDALD